MKNVIAPSEDDKLYLMYMGRYGGVITILLIFGTLFNCSQQSLTKVMPMIDLLQYFAFLVYLNLELPFNIAAFCGMIHSKNMVSMLEGMTGMKLNEMAEKFTKENAGTSADCTLSGTQKVPTMTLAIPAYPHPGSPAT